MASARVPYVVKEQVGEVKEEAEVMETCSLVGVLVVENGFLASRVTELEEEVRRLQKMVKALERKRCVKRLKCRFC